MKATTHFASFTKLQK